MSEKNNSESSSHASKSLLDDLYALVAEAEQMVSGTDSHRTDDMVAALRDRCTNAKERMGELCASTSKRIVAGAKCTDVAIRENPYQSLAIAAGVGLLLGVLLGRRSH